MMLLGPRGLSLWELYGLFIKKASLLLGLFSFVPWDFRLMMGPLGFVLAGFLMLATVPEFSVCSLVVCPLGNSRVLVGPLCVLLQKLCLIVGPLS
jgi:hypothetical protein